MTTNPTDQAPRTVVHGTVTAYADGCRCPWCKVARRDYDAQRRRIAARGPEVRTTDLPTPATAHPVGARRARIAALENLAAKVDAQLTAERAALARIEDLPAFIPTPALPHTVTNGRAEVPTSTTAANGPGSIRAWCRANGWPNLGDRGAMPADALDAYHNHHPT